MIIIMMMILLLLLLLIINTGLKLPSVLKLKEKLMVDVTAPLTLLKAPYTLVSYDVRGQCI